MLSIEAGVHRTSGIHSLKRFSGETFQMFQTRGPSIISDNTVVFAETYMYACVDVYQ